MISVLSRLRAVFLVAGLGCLGNAPARADLMVTLEGVTFGDGGTASGYFTLNVYGQIEEANITTTAGETLGNVAIPGFTYTNVGSSVPNTPVFDSLFYFNAQSEAFSLALDAEQALTPGFSGYDSLVLGSDVGGTPAGSIEDCQENATYCGGANYLDGRLITAGSLYAPEPATITLLGLGAAIVPILRRRQARPRDAT